MIEIEIIVTLLVIFFLIDSKNRKIRKLEKEVSELKVKKRLK